MGNIVVTFGFEWAAFLSFLITITLILILSPLAARFGLMDHPSERKQHAASTPLIGGIAMFCAVFASLAITDLPLQTLGPFFAGAVTLVAFGTIDDINEIDYRARFLVQALAAAILVFCGDLRIDSLGNLLGLGPIDLGPFSVPFTIFAVVGMINAINMLDGMDGLAGMVCLGILAPIILFSGLLGAAHIATVGIIVAMSVAGFLLFNYRLPWRTEARVFMGDAGSNLLGFTLAWLSLMLTQSETLQLSPIAILWVVGYPVIDTIRTMRRRRKRGISPFLPSRDHVHFLLHQAGFGTNTVVLIVSGLSAILTSSAFVARMEGIAEPIMTLGFILLFLGHDSLLSHGIRLSRSGKDLAQRRQDADTRKN